MPPLVGGFVASSFITHFIINMVVVPIKFVDHPTTNFSISSIDKSNMI
jgi:hypothetical protein